MRNIQTILNSILSKNIFDYILVDRELTIKDFSSTVDKYLGHFPKRGHSILECLPELVGNEEEVKKIFAKRYCLYTLESVYKNDYYVNISIEYCDQQTAIVLIHNITAITISQQNLLQYSNESTLLYNTLQKVVDNQNALIFATNSNEIEFANKKFMSYFETSCIEEIKEQHLQLYKKLNSSLKSYEELFRALNGNEDYIKINSDTFIIQATSIELTRQLFTLTKITNISNEIQIDTLTGIYKKDYLSNKLEKMIRLQKKFILVVLDIDNFKQVNDNFGHLAGDSVLKEFAALVNSNIRKNDIFARWGGEEFMILFEDYSIEDASKKMENIRILIESHDFGIDETLTSSFGLTQQQDNDNLEKLINRADKALYKAKRSGKNRVIAL